MDKAGASQYPQTIPLSATPQVTHIKTIKREDELIEIQSDTGTWYRRWLVRFLNLSQQVRPDRALGWTHSPAVSLCHLSCPVPSIGLEQLPAVLCARVPPRHADDDGRVVHHVLQVGLGGPASCAGVGRWGQPQRRGGIQGCCQPTAWPEMGSARMGLGWDWQHWDGTGMGWTALGWDWDGTGSSGMGLATLGLDGQHWDWTEMGLAMLGWDWDRMDSAGMGQVALRQDWNGTGSTGMGVGWDEHHWDGNGTGTDSTETGWTELEWDCQCDGQYWDGTGSGSDSTGTGQAALGRDGHRGARVQPLSPCSYYGLTVWFPDMIKHLQNIEYASRTKLFTHEKVRHFTFNFTLENQIHKGGEYFNDKCVLGCAEAGPACCMSGGDEPGSSPPHSNPTRFIGLRMKSVTFEDSLFEECYFEDITSSNTFFKNCTFISTVFYNTGRGGGVRTVPKGVTEMEGG